MTNEQKIVKVFAIVLAVFICISIFSAVLSGIGLLFSFGDYDREGNTATETIDTREIEKLEIDMAATSLVIERGADFKIEKMNIKNDVNVKVSGTTLKVIEKHAHFWNNNNGTIVIRIPTYIELDKVKIDMGAGKVTISNLEAQSLDIDQGVGTLDIESSRFDEAEIDGGVGKMHIEDSTFYNFDLSSGMGSVDIEALFLGKTKIEGGVGSIDLRIRGSKRDFTIITEKGIGSITVDGDQINSREGDGPNLLDIESGIGSIKINFN